MDWHPRDMLDSFISRLEAARASLLGQATPSDEAGNNAEGERRQVEEHGEKQNTADVKSPPRKKTRANPTIISDRQAQPLQLCSSTPSLTVVSEHVSLQEH